MAAWYTDIPAIEPQEPPQYVKEMLELWDEIQVTPAGEELVELQSQLTEMQAGEFMYIGVTTGAPAYGIVSNRPATEFRDRIVDDWTIGSPAGVVDMSTLFFRE